MRKLAKDAYKNLLIQNELRMPKTDCTHLRMRAVCCEHVQIAYGVIHAVIRSQLNDICLILNNALLRP